MKLAIGLVLAAVAVASVSAGDPATLSSKTPVEEATKTTKATKSSKSTKTSETSGSGIGSLFDDGSGGVIGDESDLKLLTDSGSWDWSWDSVEGSGSSHYDCDTVCPTDYEPVCGSDNVTYKNECAFTVAQCNATELAVANSGKCALGSASTAGSSTSKSCPDACTMEYSPVVDENGKEYPNECSMRLAKSRGMKEAEAPSTATKSSKSTKATKSEKTGTASDSGIGSLFEDGSDGIIGENESGSADPTLVKGAVDSLVNGTKTHADEEQQSVSEKTLPAAKSTKVTV
ncbi:hypothetical protein PF002_g6592 [Phytophthora fragariae]|uniref:Kazal-like domain-containing protein n=1 Tax=Phytophthora fragariae TaxID=53985 RepID=A0A6A4A1D0_9STRA|nr:hypothetical protein PF007_g25860 [Phytophthora fragariae]KAE9246740.1 hypothetical protein PF002_g6592 [Phytophthora fragariae]KAE9278531.1 hypothetical protein PF001_g25120 [Phytophthora fragariae]